MTNTTVVNGQAVDTVTGEIMVRPEEVVTGVSVQNVFGDSTGGVLSSIKAETPAQKMSLYNAIQKESKSLKDAVNIEFILKDFVAHEVTFNEDNGAKTEGVRIILLDDKGAAYSGSGIGIRNSLQKIFGIFGQPEAWEGFDLKVKAVSKAVGNAGESTVLLEIVEVIEHKNK